jgi:hypothetical protein
MGKKQYILYIKDLYYIYYINPCIQYYNNNSYRKTNAPNTYNTTRPFHNVTTFFLHLTKNLYKSP